MKRAKNKLLVLLCWAVLISVFVGIATILVVRKVTKPRFSHGGQVYSWYSPNIGDALPHAPTGRFNVRFNGRTYTDLIGEAPGYLDVPVANAIFFLQMKPGGPEECHLLLLDNGTDLNFGGNAVILGFYIGDAHARFKAEKIKPDILEISCAVNNETFCYRFDLARIETQMVDKK